MGSLFILRQFSPSDIDRVIYINRVCLPENYSTHFFMDLFKKFPETFIVAEEDGEAVGYIMCRIESGLPSLRSFELPRKGHIISVAVLPQYRGRGIGYSLVQRALERMAHYRAKECYLEVRVSNTAAVNLYKKLDFKTTRTVRGYYADGENAHIMSRELPLSE